VEKEKEGWFKTGRRGISAERIARRMLESKGYSIIATNYKINSKGENIGEIDIVAEKDGEKYAVEVKSGKASFSSIRQAYANAKLAGYRPLLICKKSDEATKEAARKLGVEIIEFSEYHLLLEPEEIESIVKNCMEEVMEKYGYLPHAFMSGGDIKFFGVIAESQNMEEVIKKLGIDEKKFGEKLSSLSKKGILPSRSLSFKDLKKYSMSVISQIEIVERLKEIEREVKDIKKMLQRIIGG